MLDQAAMEHCLADAFHPGCEMTWPMRNSMMYLAPFRLAHAATDWIEPQYGAALIQDTLSLPNGPLAAQVPGGVTRWMAVPWQTDTASCRSGYIKSYDPYLPTFWPARVPNQVLTNESYEIVMDKNRPLDERITAFANRAAWIRGLGKKSYTDQINNMIRDFGKLGVVEVREGPGDKEFPATMEVEQLPPQKVLLKAVAGADRNRRRNRRVPTVLENRAVYWLTQRSGAASRRAECSSHRRSSRATALENRSRDRSCGSDWRE
jgi:hypothetical protein